MAEYPIQQPNTDNPNSLLPLDISRQDPDQPRASSINLEAHDTTPSRRPHSSTYRGYPENTGTFRLYHPRPDQASADQPPSKKMHRHDSEDRTEGSVDRSTPSASSQSGIEDQETEADQSQRSEASPAPTTFAFAVPKKKRTRTLTTPHQAAVLHALLAQSRFPTTAMREEVGKQIGLSARKVQIWFQNQRQKAKRPSTQGAATSNQPAHLAHVASASSTSTSSPTIEFYSPTSDSGAAGHATSSRHPEHPWASGQRRRGLDGRFLPPEDAPQSLTPGFWLSGPGMPGSSYSVQSGPPGPGTRPPSSQHSYTSLHRLLPCESADSHGRMPFRRHSQSPPRMHDTAPHPSFMHLNIDDTRERPFSRTLPPLVFDSPHPRESLSPSPSSYHLPPVTPSAPSTTPYLDIPSRSSTYHNTESPFAHHAPEQRPPRDIPAPFALQPRPQWDNHSLYGSYSRPSTSSWSRPSTAYSASGDDSGSHTIRSHERVVYDLVTRQNQQREHRDEASTSASRPGPASRMSRYDPVYDSMSSNGGNLCRDS